MKEKYTHVRIDREDKEVIAEFLKKRRMSWADLFRKLSPICRDMMALSECTTLEIKLRL